jgi:uncharacterized protein YbjT (DUF2867 family)
MILVVGATGCLGRAICRRLVHKGMATRSFVRPTSDPAKVDYLQSLGLEVVRGDLNDAKSLDAACKGITTIITTASAVLSKQPGDTIQDTDLAGQIRLLEAARAASVSRLIYISLSENFGTESPLLAAKRTVERYLSQSGMAFTILRLGFLMEAWLSPKLGFDFANAKATIYGAGNNKMSWISQGDVANFAVSSLDEHASDNATLELGGPEALSPLEVVHIFEDALGKRFEVRHIPAETLHTQNAQASDDVQQSLSALLLDYAMGGVIDMKPTLQVFPVKLLTITEYVQYLQVEARR